MVKHIADRVAVMYLGRIVETAPTDEIFANPRHPYTQALLSAIPVPRPRARRDRTILQGDVPSPINPPPGCHLHARCPHAIERCRVERPALIAGGDHATACHRWPELPPAAADAAAEGGRSPVLERLIGAFAHPMDVRRRAGVDTVEARRRGSARQSLRGETMKHCVSRRPPRCRAQLRHGSGAVHLRIGLAEDPDVLDPTLARTYVGRIVFASICDKLFDIDEKLKVVPQLALSHETSADGKAVTIKLRPNVKFHDGEPIDAEAAKFSLERHMTMQGSFRKPEIGAIDQSRWSIRSPSSSFSRRRSRR